MQDMLDCVNNISKRYHIEFGKAKSKALKIGGKLKTEPFKLGDMAIKFTELRVAPRV